MTFIPNMNSFSIDSNTGYNSLISYLVRYMSDASSNELKRPSTNPNMTLQSNIITYSYSFALIIT